ncbi:hypothetical protein [Candidatus Leptofilum sp.]|uniref:hypothetical protein n=1 Tax=Candidatus Leptofilum sp. TaxID=3241576 RepID=UPI003B5C2D27
MNGSSASLSSVFLLGFLGIASIFLMALVDVEIGYWGFVFIFAFYVITGGRSVLAEYEVKSWIAFAISALNALFVLQFWIFCGLISGWMLLSIEELQDNFLILCFPYLILVFFSYRLVIGSNRIFFARWFGNHRKKGLNV